MTAESKQAALDLLQRGVDMAREQRRPWWILGTLDRAIKHLERDEHEELASALLAIGYGWHETDAAKLIRDLRKRLADQLREQREQRRCAGQLKAGKTKADLAMVRSRIEELRGQGKQEQQIDDTIWEEFQVKGRTRRAWQKKFWQ